MDLTTVQSSRIDVDERVQADLRDRLERTRWFGGIADSGWDYGTDLDYLRGHRATLAHDGRGIQR